MKKICLAGLFLLLAAATVSAGNPIIKHIFTADAAALVHSGRMYIYTGHDEQAAGAQGFKMDDWHVFSSADMVNWTDHGEVLKISNFRWAKSDAWAGQCIERNGKFYWYVPMSHKSINGFAIGVAVSDSPTGPFTDAKGAALITNNMTTGTDITWDDIDPTVFIDDDGQAYLFWGNTRCKVAKLKANMIELDGSIREVAGLTGFTEGPYIHKANGIYYLSYAAGYPETIDYATSNTPLGPWTYRGRINDLVANSPTNHQAILEFKGQWYFVYHNAGLPTGGEFRRSVCVDYLYYNSDKMIRKVVQTTQGVASTGTSGSGQPTTDPETPAPGGCNSSSGPASGCN